jgi:CRP/FNR family transcriptional regulator, cyclic AMP receptor protein
VPQDAARAALLAELAKFDFFSGLSADDLGRVADAVAEQRTFDPGQVLVDQGEVAMDCLLVVEGLAQVRRGNDPPVNMIGPGEPVGEIGAADYSYRSARVVAETSVRAFVIPARRFRELLDELPGARAALDAKMSARLQQLRGD